MKALSIALLVTGLGAGRVVLPAEAQGYGHSSQTSNATSSVNPIPGIGSMVGGTQPGTTAPIVPVQTVIVPGAPTVPVQSTTVVNSTTSVQQTSGSGTTTTTSSSTTSVTNQTPELRPAQDSQKVTASMYKYKYQRVRSDWHTAKRMARYHWLDKSVQADPTLVEAICQHYVAAKILAAHPRLGEIAQYDHYTCRRLTKWKTCARILASNGACDKVVALDPEGIYRAIKRDREVAKLLSTNPNFSVMIEENPDLGALISKYM